MRPAREGRENVLARREATQCRLASMRPAREGRENEHRDNDGALCHSASMRPAREGRENEVAVRAVAGHGPLQ